MWAYFYPKAGWSPKLTVIGPLAFTDFTPGRKFRGGVAWEIGERMGHSRSAVLLQGSSLSAAIALRFLRQKLDPGVSTGQRL